jgi:hypothetical protein
MTLKTSSIEIASSCNPVLCFSRGSIYTRAEYPHQRCHAVVTGNVVVYKVELIVLRPSARMPAMPPSLACTALPNSVISKKPVGLSNALDPSGFRPFEVKCLSNPDCHPEFLALVAVVFIFDIAVLPSPDRIFRHRISVPYPTESRSPFASTIAARPGEIPRSQRSGVAKHAVLICCWRVKRAAE